MTNTMAQGVEAVEEMGPQMSGTVTILNEKYGQITDENGETHMFYPTFLESIDSYSRDGKSGEALLKDFSNYQVGTKVIFNLSSTAGNKDISHVMVDTSTGVDTLVPEVKTNIGEIVRETVEGLTPAEQDIRLYAGMADLIKRPTIDMWALTPEEAIEQIGPLMQGVVSRKDNQRGRGYIAGDNGVQYYFAFPFFNKDIGEAQEIFNNLNEGDNVKFNADLNKRVATRISVT